MNPEIQKEAPEFVEASPVDNNLKDWLLKQHQKALLDGVDMGTTYTKARIIKELKRRITEHDPELTGDGPCACLGYEAVIEWLEDEDK